MSSYRGGLWLVWLWAILTTKGQVLPPDTGLQFGANGRAAQPHESPMPKYASEPLHYTGRDWLLTLGCVLCVRVLDMRGIVKVSRKEPGTIAQVVPKVRQVFHRLDCASISQIDDFRFQYFTTKVYIFFNYEAVSLRFFRFSLEPRQLIIHFLTDLSTIEDIGVKTRVHFHPFILWLCENTKLHQGRSWWTKLCPLLRVSSPNDMPAGF